MSKFSAGYTLPSVMILSAVMLALLTISLQLVGASSSALRDQYYEQLSREASEAGIVRAEACIKTNSVAEWSDAKPLKPDTDCNGDPISGLNCSSSEDSRCFVAKIGHIKTTYSIGAITGTLGNHKYIANGQASLVSSTGNVYKALSSGINYSSQNSATPTVTGGAGWGESTGHINIYKSVDGSIYGFGDNASGQINDAKSPTAVTKPTKMSLPDGASPVSDVQTSGQGASYLCVIGADQKAYCRGNGFSLSDGWTQVGFAGNPPNMKVYDLALNGYSSDYICVIAGTSASTKQAYCAGDDWYGILGDGSNTEIPAPITAMKKFVLPGTLTTKSIESKSFNTCVIASDNNAYCSGISDNGQIATTQSERNDTPAKYQLPNRGDMARRAKAVYMSPHSDSSTMMVLATDGTLWVSGNKEWGSFGTGETSGETGTGIARLWGSSNTNWDGDNATGGSIKVQGTNKCIDNDYDDLVNGNLVKTYECNSSARAMKWFLLDNGDGTSSIWQSGKAGSPTNFCLDLDDGVVTNGTPISLWTCIDTNTDPSRENQKWVVHPTDGTIRLNKNQSKCIGTLGNPVSSNTSLAIYDCSHSNARKFVIDGRAKPWQDGIALNFTFCGMRDDEYGGLWCSGKTAPTDHLGRQNDYNFCLNSQNPKKIQFPTGTPSDVRVDVSKFSREWKYQIDSLMFIATDGQVYGAGRNVYGKLGNGSSISSVNNYRQCSFNKFILPLGVTAKDMTARDEFSTFVLGANGRIYASGLNYRGQLGNNSVSDTNSPVESKTPVGTGYSY